MPNTEDHTPNTAKHRTPNTTHTPNTKHKTSNTRHQTPNTAHQTPNTEHQTPNTKHRTPNTKHPTYMQGKPGTRGKRDKPYQDSGARTREPPAVRGNVRAGEAGHTGQRVPRFGGPDPGTAGRKGKRTCGGDRAHGTDRSKIREPGPGNRRR